MDMGTKYILCYVFLYMIGKTCAASDASGNNCNPGYPGDGKCGEGEGDCDDDEQCLPGLKCGNNNCPKKNGMPRNFDCCYRPTPVKKCATSEASGSCCNPGHPGDGKCGEDEGDCDNDTQCLPGLKCGNDNCPKENGMPSNFDCCYRPTPGKQCSTSDASGSCCNPRNPGDGKCGEDEGDCDNDTHCLPGLKCGFDNCPKGNGMPNNFDCCYRPTSVVDGGWTPWGSCSRSCKGGEQKRTCTNPPPSYDGKGCYGRNIKLCNRYIHCGVDGGWTSWGHCSKSCEGGKQKRTCTNPPPSTGHRGCYGRGEKRCNRKINCAVNGSWTPWGSCNKSCKGGQQKRICANPPPSYGGIGCDGKNSQECNSNIKCHDGCRDAICAGTCVNTSHASPPAGLIPNGYQCNGNKQCLCYAEKGCLDDFCPNKNKGQCIGANQEKPAGWVFGHWWCKGKEGCECYVPDDCTFEPSCESTQECTKAHGSCFSKEPAGGYLVKWAKCGKKCLCYRKTKHCERATN